MIYIWIGSTKCNISLNQIGWQSRVFTLTVSLVYVFSITDKLYVQKWPIYTSVNDGIIDSVNGLSPVRHEAITPTIANLLWTETLDTNFSES